MRSRISDPPPNKPFPSSKIRKERSAIKAIITDLDNTLLRSDKTLSAHTIEVLDRCRKQGIPVMAATARPFRGIEKYHKLVHFDAVTTMNGAIIRLPERELHFGISPESGEAILSRMMELPDITLSIETSTGLYSNRDIPEWAPILYPHFPTLPAGSILYKILASSPRQELYQQISGLLTDDVYYSIATNDLVQVMSSQATKWVGIQHMLAAVGLSPQDAVYFGDDNDDLTPIASCGLGVAVANAIPPVLEAARQVTSSNDQDGVALFLEEHILGKG